MIDTVSKIPTKHPGDAEAAVRLFAGSVTEGILVQRIEEFFGEGRCFLLAKGRVGLYAGVKALGLPAGSRILMPGYSCLVVPAALKYAGLEPVYCDIDPTTYNVDAACVENGVASDVRAILVQHTYGIPAPVPDIALWAKDRDVAVIEDCCHAFGTRIGGRLCGTFGQFSFMSGQWNKPLCTGLGGFLLVNDASLAARVERIIQEEGEVPGLLRNFILKVQMIAFDHLVRPTTSGVMTDVYRLLSRLGLAIGSSAPCEYRGEIPAGFFARMAACQVERGLREMLRAQELIHHREKITAFYHEALSQIGLRPLLVSGAKSLPLLRYPVRVGNKADVLAQARRCGLEIGSWFESPLHPEGTRLEDFGYRLGMCPEAERACREVINLPTGALIDELRAERHVEFLRRYARAA